MLRKTYTKTGRFCWVTFDLTPQIDAKVVSLCGEFNDWNPTSHLMKRRKGGRFSATISLKAGQLYRFRYLLDGRRWENDWAADGYVPNCFGTEDSVAKI